MKKIIFICSILVFSVQVSGQQVLKYVDVFLGTGGVGHVYPGAVAPFGMVQLSPDNGEEGWEYCAGYNYKSNHIAGFSHTHLSGTGIGDLCDISVLPLLDTSLIRGSIIKHSFKHQNEKGSPGFYSVKLDNGIECSFTASERIGFHKYSFPQKTGWILFNMGFRINTDKPTNSMLQVIDSFTIAGFRESTGWAKFQKIYFTATFSEPIANYISLDDTSKNNNIFSGKNVKLALKFNAQKPIFVKVALSHVGIDKAILELKNNGQNNFETVLKSTQNKWKKELEKIKIKTSNDTIKTLFYTSLYRTCLAPTLYSDADKYYRNYKNELKQINNAANKYTIFSQWDVFRALFPLFSITQQSKMPDFINSMYNFYEDNGLLPVWDIQTWEANTMSGYHSIPIISDAILKNTSGIDNHKLYEAMKKSAFQKIRGTPEFIKYGYIPQDLVGQSVTKTLEYSYDDWCIAQVAKKLGYENDYNDFMKRASNYKNLFDKRVGFFRSKNVAGEFIEPFDPLLSEHGNKGQYIEGTAWQHSFFVPQDLPGFIDLFGKKELFEKKLDELFNSSSVLHGDNVSSDVTGLIGQYAHGNEPSHHIIYFYSLLGKYQKTAKWLKVVMDSMYKLGPLGLSGNDDCGQMSAWYIWTSLGMYPFNPADGKYVFGMPFVDEAEIQLINNKKIRIKVIKNNNKKGNFIQAVYWNGKKLDDTFIKHSSLIEGGDLSFYLGND